MWCVPLQFFNMWNAPVIDHHWNLCNYQSKKFVRELLHCIQHALKCEVIRPHTKSPVFGSILFDRKCRQISRALRKEQPDKLVCIVHSSRIWDSLRRPLLPLSPIKPPSVPSSLGLDGVHICIESNTHHNPSYWSSTTLGSIGSKGAFVLKKMTGMEKASKRYMNTVINWIILSTTSKNKNGIEDAYQRDCSTASFEAQWVHDEKARFTLSSPSQLTTASSASTKSPFASEPHSRYGRTSLPSMMCKAPVNASNINVSTVSPSW